MFDGANHLKITIDRIYMDKYQELRKFILENFEETENKKDRLHTIDILNILMDNKFMFSSSKMAQVFKSMKIGHHTSDCTIHYKSKAGYYNLIYKKKK